NSVGVVTHYEENTYTRKSNDSTGYGIIKFGRSHEGYPFEFYYGARINALVTDGKAKILSRPNVTTIQGREAVINVGSSVPVPKVSSTNTSTTTSIEYRDAGIILRYTPRINSDGTITAKIHTEVSTPQYIPDMQAYRFNTRSAETTVTVRDGEPMIIGGLIGAEEAKSVSKIPFLGDLPILGALFRNHRKSKSESELIIFLTAHVLRGASNETLSDKP
ncbi:MAG: type II and III secretion system protein, partial [Selenomonadaceae bacterium]|nr:type II and III secretion system protein [Selenomonadaceae bacterium]